MVQLLEVTLRDEDIQAIITGLTTHRDNLEGVANRIQARQLENWQENRAGNNAGMP